LGLLLFLPRHYPLHPYLSSDDLYLLHPYLMLKLSELRLPKQKRVKNLKQRKMKQIEK